MQENIPREVSAVCQHPSVRPYVRSVRHFPRTQCSRVTLNNGLRISVAYRTEGFLPNYCDPEEGTVELAVINRSGQLLDVAGEGMGHSSVLAYASVAQVADLAYRYGRRIPR